MKQALIYSTLRSDGRFFSDLVRALAAQTVHCTVIAAAEGNGGLRFRRPRLPESAFAALMLLPLWYGLALISLLAKKASGIETVICCGYSEKVILSPIARLLKLNVVWLEFPNADQRLLTGWYGRALQRAARSAKRVVFSSQAKQQLSTGGHDRFSVILPAALQETERYQEDMFRRLASGERRRFVIGSIIETLDKSLIERLLSGLSIARTVSAEMELVIIGEGETRKQLQWLIRKMNLDRYVWLVGDAERSLQWLEHLSVYVLASTHPGLDEIGGALAAMNRGVPVLADRQAGIDDIINAKTGALLDMADSETLARHLLKLEQDEELCRALGREAKLRTERLTFAALASELALLL